jgi:uncharacterized protein (DUF2164 family)
MSTQQPLQFPEAVIKLARYLEPETVLMSAGRFAVPKDGSYYFYNQGRDSITVINPQRRTMGRPAAALEQQLRSANGMSAAVI